MLIKIGRNILLVILVSLLSSSCSTVKKAFDPERKNSSEEFLVKKKSPLSMPPNFDELPIPKKNALKDNELIKDNDFESLILSSQNKEKTKNVDIDNTDNLESSILDKIKNN